MGRGGRAHAAACCVGALSEAAAEAQVEVKSDGLETAFEREQL